MRDRLALLALIGFALGCALESSHAIPLSAVLFILLLSAGFFFAWFFGKRDAYLYPALFLLFLSLAAARTLAAPTELPASFTHAIGTEVDWTGTVVADPDIRESSARITVAVREGSERMRLIAVTDRHARVAYGDTVRVSGTFTKPEAFATDGGREFAYPLFLAKGGVFGMIERAHVEATGENGAYLPMRLLYGAKHAFSRALEDALPEPHASLAEGLIVGGKQGLGKDLLEAFTIAGLLPIVVLSGYNVMVIAQALLAGLSFLPKRFAYGTAAFAIIAFVLAAGTGASAIRAGLMALLALYGRASGKTYDALRGLLAVFALLLLWNPLSLLYDPGFQLSFLATLGLILLTDPLMQRLLWVRARFLREVLATTLSAQLFVLPLLLYETGNLSVFAVPANVLALPVVPFAMLFAAVAGAIALVAPPLALIAGLPAYAFLSYLVAVAEVVARIPFATLTLPVFPAWLLVPAYLALGWFVWRIRKTAPGSAVSPSHRKAR